MKRNAAQISFFNGYICFSGADVDIRLNRVTFKSTILEFLGLNLQVARKLQRVVLILVRLLLAIIQNFFNIGPFDIVGGQVHFQRQPAAGKNYF